MSHSIVRRIAIAALALPLLLGGCADDAPAPTAPQTRSPTSPATQTTTAPVEPTLPPEAEGKGVKAAEAFVRHFYASVDYAQAAGETKALRAMASSECDACRGGADVIDQIHGVGGEIVGGEHTVESTKITGRQQIPGEGAIYYLNVRVGHTKQSVVGADDLDGDYGAGTDNLRFIVVRSTSGWQVSQWYEL